MLSSRLLISHFESVNLISGLVSCNPQTATFNLCPIILWLTNKLDNMKKFDLFINKTNIFRCIELTLNSVFIIIYFVNYINASQKHEWD